MSIVETCKCGAQTRIVGSPATVTLQIASFRDAHKPCREPAYEVVSIPTISERQGKTPYDDLPCGKCGGDRLRPMFGQGGEACHAPSKVEPFERGVREMEPKVRAVLAMLTPKPCPKCGHLDIETDVCRRHVDKIAGKDVYCGCEDTYHRAIEP